MIDNFVFLIVMVAVPLFCFWADKSEKTEKAELIKKANEQNITTSNTHKFNRESVQKRNEY